MKNKLKIVLITLFFIISMNNISFASQNDENKKRHNDMLNKSLFIGLSIIYVHFPAVSSRSKSAELHTNAPK